LDRNGVVRLGSWVETDDILVGKLTPQIASESSYIAEAGLLRAIFDLEVSTSKETYQAENGSHRAKNGSREAKTGHFRPKTGNERQKDKAHIRLKMSHARRNSSHRAENG
jgi:hypothetical protein